ncbi:MAG: hypothetical protein PWP23_3105 [Candidatus Sumerlaeota bacterium]|nr:hypothetical protein [Candidatus Sumerlaeota bacterium]
MPPKRPSQLIDNVVPWGRTFDEYRRMFALSREDFALRLLGIGDGPASFNAELTAMGGRVVSVDPVYAFGGSQIGARFDAVSDDILEMVRRDRDRFVWDDIRTPEEMVDRRRTALERFLVDYEGGRCRGRYVAASLPALPFSGGAFDLAVCSHLLFLYSHVFDAEAHVAALRELLRVAREVRVFPLIDMEGAPSGHAGAVRDALTAEGFRVSIECVPYEFQRGANQMMRIAAR